MGRLRLGKRHLQIIIAAAVLLVIIACALLAPVLSRYEPTDYDVPRRLEKPSDDHIFGTDQYGRDLFCRVVYGARLTFLIGLEVVVFCGLIGIAFGLLAGYYPKAETVIMRVMDGLMAFPAILLALVIVAALGPGVRNIVIALGISYTPRVARLVRGIVLVVKQFDHVEAARESGASGLRIMLKHILPLCWSPIIVILTLIMAYSALAEASLTFLGVGLPPNVPSWGNILSEGRLYMQDAPWLTIIPGLSIMISVFSMNLLGDGIRDFLDPRLRNV